MDPVEVRPVGRVSSELTDPAAAPKQPDEGAPEAWLVLEEGFAPAAADLRPGDRVVVLTWLDRADREALQVHPRDDASNPLTGIFATRSQDRPNPIGLHETEIAEVDGDRIRVTALEALDGTPILDVKPVIGSVETR
jgi:tRNA-Thr(GGU) m(6)t(6)A37 methyltransferase TsaA